jgi:hypothetical protein
MWKEFDQQVLHDDKQRQKSNTTNRREYKGDRLATACRTTLAINTITPMIPTTTYRISFCYKVPVQFAPHYVVGHCITDIPPDILCFRILKQCTEVVRHRQMSVRYSNIYNCKDWSCVSPYIILTPGFIKCRGRAANTSAYSETPGFKSRPPDRLLSLRFFVVFLCFQASPGEVPCNTPRPLTAVRFAVHYLLIILSLHAISL